jgi:hypothetical protein
MKLYGAAIAVSAFLLFLVQPIIAKMILPWFGGSAAVWTTCMVFFQCVLLAGYFYSDFMVRQMRLRSQVLLHGLLLLASLAFLPIVPDALLKPADGDNPIGRILLLLLLTIGLPYFMLSTTGPLIQAWFAKRFVDAQVYRLYAVSNIASMLALLAYPPLIEPQSSSVEQSWGWSAGYLVFVVLTGLCAFVTYRNTAGHAQAVAGDAGLMSGPNAAGAQAAPSPWLQLTWWALAALGSILLLTVTTHITQNVASVPFLWIIPLIIYLMSFILCFDGRAWYMRNWYLPLTCIFGVLMVAGLMYRPGDSGWPEQGLLHFEHAVPLYCLGLFILCMFVHGELVARKPATNHLTRFYLMISLGGASGGLLVGIAAPLLTNWTWELPLVFVACLIAAAWIASGLLRTIALFAAAAGMAIAVQYAAFIQTDTIELSRNFYGTLRVKATAPDDQDSARWRLLHGVITHGEQFRSPQFRRLATTYYGGESGVGLSLQALDELHPQAGKKVGLIGLGIGTLAAYGATPDTYRMYELNPAVVDLARDKFTYLKDSKARIEYALGDARLVLEREKPQGFDLLAVDAFSSDSIPVHLITREALAVYSRHLSAHGAVAFHISNRYLDLTGVVKQLADNAGMRALRVVHDPPDTSFLYRSDWVILTRDARLIEWLERSGKAVDITPRESSQPKARIWTDSYNNLFEVLK